MQEGKPVLRSVADLVKYGLDASISPNIPNLDDLVRPQTDQVVPVLVYGQILHTRVVTVEVGERPQCEGIPHNDVALLAATGHEAVLRRVDKGVDSLLMEVEGLVLLVGEVLDIVDVDEAIERGGDDVVEVCVELYLGDPALVYLLLYDLHSVVHPVEPHYLFALLGSSSAALIHRPTALQALSH